MLNYRRPRHRSTRKTAYGIPRIVSAGFSVTAVRCSSGFELRRPSGAGTMLHLRTRHSVSATRPRDQDWPAADCRESHRNIGPFAWRRSYASKSQHEIGMNFFERALTIRVFLDELDDMESEIRLDHRRNFAGRFQRIGRGRKWLGHLVQSGARDASMVVRFARIVGIFFDEILELIRMRACGCFDFTDARLGFFLGTVLCRNEHVFDDRAPLSTNSSL